MKSDLKTVAILYLMMWEFLRMNCIDFIGLLVPTTMGLKMTTHIYFSPRFCWLHSFFLLRMLQCMVQVIKHQHKCII